jgi:UDPglucose 6-dehydrogenase
MNDKHHYIKNKHNKMDITKENIDYIKYKDMELKNNLIKYNKLEFVSSNEAEMIKYFKNVFLAVKVGICNEIEMFCSKKQINYNTVRNLACDDDRITSSHTHVPGHDEKRGFGGTCFTKDINSLKFEMKKEKLNPLILESVITRNNTIDRPNDEQEKGRGII